MPSNAPRATAYTSNRKPMPTSPTSGGNTSGSPYTTMPMPAPIPEPYVDSQPDRPATTPTGVPQLPGQPLPARNYTVQPYPTTPQPLSPDDLAVINARRRAASAGLETALIRRDAGAKRADVDLDLAKRAIERAYGKSRRTAAGAAGDRGLAFSPGGLGRDLAALRDSQAEDTTSAEQARADRLAALEEMVRAARSDRDVELALLDAESARRRTSLDELLRVAGAA